MAENLNGTSWMFDISKSGVSKYLSGFQSADNISSQKVLPSILRLIEEVSEEIGVENENVFLQVIDQNSGGKIEPHYDTSLNGYINLKANISILGAYEINIDKEIAHVSQGDLYWFEASLYKHWAENLPRRIILSIGFGVPYEKLGRTEQDPRVRLSQRIEKYFQKI